MTKESLEGPPSGLSEAERGYNLRRKTYPDDEGIVGRSNIGIALAGTCTRQKTKSVL